MLCNFVPGIPLPVAAAGVRLDIGGGLQAAHFRRFQSLISHDSRPVLPAASAATRLHTRLGFHGCSFPFVIVETSSPSLAPRIETRHQGFLRSFNRWNLQEIVNSRFHVRFNIHGCFPFFVDGPILFKQQVLG